MSTNKASLIRSLQLHERERDGAPGARDPGPQARAEESKDLGTGVRDPLRAPNGLRTDRRTLLIAVGAGTAGIAIGCAAMLWVLPGRAPSPCN